MIDAVENKRREFLSVRCNGPTKCNTCYRLKVWNLRKSLNCFLLHKSWRFCRFVTASVQSTSRHTSRIQPRSQELSSSLPLQPLHGAGGKGKGRSGILGTRLCGIQTHKQAPNQSRSQGLSSYGAPFGVGRWKTLGTRLAPNVRKKMRRPDEIWKCCKGY